MILPLPFIGRYGQNSDAVDILLKRKFWSYVVDFLQKRKYIGSDTRLPQFADKVLRFLNRLISFIPHSGGLDETASDDDFLAINKHRKTLTDRLSSLSVRAKTKPSSAILPVARPCKRP